MARLKGRFPPIYSNLKCRSVRQFCPRFSFMKEVDKRQFWAYFFQALSGAEAGLKATSNVQHTEPQVAVVDKSVIAWCAAKACSNSPTKTPSDTDATSTGNADKQLRGTRSEQNDSAAGEQSALRCEYPREPDCRHATAAAVDKVELLVDASPRMARFSSIPPADGECALDMRAQTHRKTCTTQATQQPR